MITPNSPDISSLQVCVTWNLSNSQPQLDLVNMSTGLNLADVVYAFLIKSPSQTIINDGNVNDPDISGIWDTWTFYSANPDPTLSPPPTDYTVAPWPRPFNQIEWSGAPYSIEVFAKDSVGNIFSYVIEQEICRPAGNTNLSNNTYGKGNVTITLNCNNANAFFENITNTSYKGLAGTQESSILKVLYPDDETDTAPQPFVLPSFSNALVPITYDSDNYEFVYNAVYLYEFANCSSVLIKYYTKRRFQVNCNIDLCPLVCEVAKLIQQSETGNCTNLQEVNEKLLLINGKLNLALIAKTQPLCGIDLPTLIEEIKLIGGFDCDCCTPSGIQPFNSANLNDYNFIINTGCGDVNGYANVVGNNITFTLSDKTYIFKICDNAPTAAFTVEPSIAGCTRTYCLNVNMTTLSTDILNTIKGNTGLVNLFNSIVNQSGGGFELIVNMNCIGTSSDACDYEFTLSAIPDTPTNAILYQIQSSNGNVIVNYAFNLSTLGDLQTYLNTLGLGTFVVVNSGGGVVTITSSTNTNALTGIVYTTGLTKKIAGFASDCTGFVARSANQVVQAIIDYLCGLTDCEIVTCQDYDICYIDPASNTKQIVTVPAGTKENLFIAQLLDRNCDTIDYLVAIVGLNCNGMRGLFQPNAAYTLQNTDFIYGTKNGVCSGISPVEAFTRMLQLGIFNADAVNAFCTFVAACNGGNICAPYTTLTVAAVDSSPSSDNMNILVTFVHPAAISSHIRYARIDNTVSPIYSAPVNVLAGASPYLSPSVADGNYSVGVTPIYSDGRLCGEIFLTTGDCGVITAFSAVVNGSGDIVISYSAPVGIPKVKVVINYPNGGTASTIYTNTGTNITITPPAGVYGDYSIVMYPVCNQNTGFLGNPTGQAIVTVSPASNSITTNNTTNTLAPLSGLFERLDVPGFSTPFNVVSVAGSGGVVNFYIPDGVYGHVVLTYPTGVVGGAYLTAVSGTIVAVISANQAVFNDGFTSSGGITITLIDASPAP